MSYGRVTEKGTSVTMNKLDTFLGDIRRKEQYESLMQMPGRDLCEMVRAHFESHPALPGEKFFKDQVNDFIKQMDAGELKEDIQDSVASRYAQTRIRETPFTAMDSFQPENLKWEPVDMIKDDIVFVEQDGRAVGSDVRSRVFIDKVDVELQRSEEHVYVMADQGAGLQMIGTLPDKFLKNNPMNVDRCAAELQMVDYSNGKMKNVGYRIVADTDLMSGDVIDLDETMLTGLDQESSLEQ